MKLEAVRSSETVVTTLKTKHSKLIRSQVLNARITSYLTNVRIIVNIDPDTARFQNVN